MRATLLLLWVSACPVDPGPNAAGEDSDPPDSGLPDDSDDTAETAVESCADGLAPMPWLDAEDDPSLRATAADFTVETGDGDWTLSEHWNGCDTYLVIPSQPDQASGWPEALWARDRDTQGLFKALPDNAWVIFVSSERNEEARAAELELIQGGIYKFLEDLDDDERAAWEERIVLVTSKVGSIGGWLEDTLASPNWGVGIDRFQRIRYIGSFANPDRYNGDYGWFEPDLSLAAYEAIYYDFEAQREAVLQTVDATIVTLWDGQLVSDPGWAGQMGYVTVELPDAATMAGYDTLELDHSLLCNGEGEYGTCPAWDYLNWLYLCDADGSNCSTEIGRWITTYHREGRWVHDISSLLPVFAEGGSFTFGYYTQQEYEVYLDIRLSNSGKAERPQELLEFFSGGAATSSYNDREPMLVEIPADAKKVELAVVFSGHGQVADGEGGSCAEFCNFDHHFGVNGQDNVIDFPMVGETYGCADQTAEGTVPNQYGTWWYGRDGWCPGKEVPHRLIDVTEQVDLGATNTFTYAAYKEGQAYDNGGASLLLTSWIVISR